LGESTQLALVGEVGSDEVDGVAAGCSPDRPDRGFAAGEIPADDRHVRAAADQLPGRHKADTGAATRDET
jgi:hypothetical protein